MAKYRYTTARWPVFIQCMAVDFKRVGKEKKLQKTNKFIPIIALCGIVWLDGLSLELWVV